jgi:hypothetical protein
MPLYLPGCRIVELSAPIPLRDQTLFGDSDPNQFNSELPTVVADHGKVRLGGYGPTLPR